MKSLYLRIWLTVVAALALFAGVSTWLIQSHLEGERARAEAVLAERMASWGEMIRHSLPGPDAPLEEQAAALRTWSAKLRVPMALEDAQGRRVVISDDFPDNPEAQGRRLPVSVSLGDGRTLWMVRPGRGGGRRPPGMPDLPPQAHREGGGPPPGLHEAWHDGPPPGGPFGPPRDGRPPKPSLTDWPASLGLVALLALLFLAVAGGAYPVVRRLTRRLEALKQGMQVFGAGQLGHRVSVDGRDEVASLAVSFNQAAERIETLVRSNQSLLANASHELRSPLARLKMAVAMWADVPPAQQAELLHEINTNIRELDELVDEVLLSSRLEAGAAMLLDDSVDMLGLAAEEAAAVGAEVEGQASAVRGSERLLRRALRNLLENARRYAGDGLCVRVFEPGPGQVCVQVCDRGPGVPEEERERIFEPFYRMRGHAEREGGVGLGLALVRQIARRHGGEVRCLPREGGGSCFAITLPAQPPEAAPGASV